MVGIFSRFSRAGHRRTQSAVVEREALPPNAVLASTASTAAASTHGIEVAVEFKPVEHPMEPLNSDRPIPCPLPEPSILNDGRLWKERVSARRMRSDLPVINDGDVLEPESPETKQQRPPRRNRMILPSLSAPEHNLLNLLEECNVSGTN